MPDEAEALLKAIADTEPAVSVRVNTARGIAVPAGAVRVPWCSDAFYCDGRPRFTFDPALHAGAYYVQDASSMFIAHVIRSLVTGPVRYLDLCAAPGGKTTAAMQVLPQGSLLVANEVMPQRAKTLCDNVMRWGNPSCAVTSAAADRIGRLTHFFDVVAADVPCSGEGMFRKDVTALEQWSPRLVEECAALQRSIIDDAWDALRPGGLLIYSTCTYNRSEDEDNVAHIIEKYGALPVEVPTNDEWNIAGAVCGDAPCYRFMPHRTRGEGLFMAVLRKPDTERRREPKMKKAKPSQRPAKMPATVSQWLAQPDDYEIKMSGDSLIAVPAVHAQSLAVVEAIVGVLSMGVELGVTKGKSLVPSHALALSTALRADAFATVEVDYATAIAYLRGDAVVIDAPRGHVLLTCRGHVLGFANNLGNRANNMYPKPLRILSTHIPDEPVKVV